MSLLDLAWTLVSRLRARFECIRLERRWAHLRGLGMKLGDDVLLPGSTWI